MFKEISFYNKINYFDSKKWDFILISILIVLTVFLSLSLYENYNAALFTSDSSVFHNTVNNILQGNGMSTSLVIVEGNVVDTENGPIFSISSDIDGLIKNNPTIIQPYTKAPPFFLLEAGFFKLVGANPSNWIFYGALLSTIISLCFVILYYFLIKKNFDRGIAFFSSLGIITSWNIFTALTTARPDILMYTFLVASFFFINKSIRHYIIFGILGSLATQSHQLAAPFIYGYLAFLLYKKEFKGFLIVFLVYLSLLAPIMIYEYSITGDLKQGLGIPSSISAKLSLFINDLTGSTKTIETQILQDFYTSDFVINKVPSPFEFIIEFFSYEIPPYPFLHLYELYFISSIFLLATFVSFSKIKEKINNKSLLKTGLILSMIIFFILVYYNSNWAPENILEIHVVELLILIIIPTTLIMFSLKNLRNSNIFEKPSTRFYSLFPFLIGFGFFGLYLSTFSTWAFIFGLVLPLVFLLIPFGLNGMKKLANVVINKSIKKEHWISYLIIGLIVVSISFVNADENLKFFTTLNINIHWTENEDSKGLHNWLMKNASPDAVLMHELPAILSLHTGNPVVIIPSDFYDKPYNLPKYLDHFKVDYVVFYRQITEFENIMDVLQFERVYSCSNKCVIYKNTINWENFNTNSEDYTKLQLDWARTLMKLGKILSAYNVYAEVLDIKEFDEKTIQLLYSDKFTSNTTNQEYEKKKNLIIDSIGFDLEGIRKYYKNDLELARLKLEPIILLINPDEFISFKAGDSKFFTSKKKIVDFLQDFETLEYEIQKKLSIAKDLENQKRYNEALQLYNEIAKIDEFNFQVYESKIRIFKSLDNENLINEAYDEFYDQYLKKIDNYKKFNLPVNNLEENHISLYYSEINFWYEDDSFYKILSAYNEIMGMNQFDFNATLGKAEVLEILDRLPEALRTYELAFRLIPENYSDDDVKKIEDKIKELKSK